MNRNRSHHISQLFSEMPLFMHGAQAPVWVASLYKSVHRHGLGRGNIARRIHLRNEPVAGVPGLARATHSAQPAGSDRDVSSESSPVAA